MCRSLALVLVVPSLLESGLHGADVIPGPDGWIRHWVVYGPIGTLIFDPNQHHLEQLHPFTLEPFVLLDLIAEPEGKEHRLTELNFLPAPGREIDTAFGTISPGHILRRDSRPGINPNGKLMGVGWADCDCQLNFYDVLGLDARFSIRDYLVYSYTYVENISGKTLHVFISLSADDGVHVLLGRVPHAEGPDFMRTIFMHNDPYTNAPCIELVGPDPEGEKGPTHLLSETVTIEPGLHLLLAKVTNANWENLLSFRFRHNDPPNYTPVMGDEIRIRLSPDPGAPNPPLFRRMDTDGDGFLAINDAVRTLMYLFSGAGAPACLDASDADDDGEVTLADPIHTLQCLFQAGAMPSWVQACCGIDPTEDDLPECVYDGGNC